MLVIWHRLGGPIIFMGRCEFLRILYKHIRDKSRVLAQTAVVSYEEDEDGITVTASDGMKYCGDILVGTDGVHSTVAQLMTEKLNKEKPSISNDFQKGLYFFFLPRPPLRATNSGTFFCADISHVKHSLANTSAYSAYPTMIRLLPFWQKTA